MSPKKLLPFELAVTPVLASVRRLSPFVSTEWLAQDIIDSRIVIVDTRKVEEYMEGHIPGSVSGFFGTWIAECSKLMLDVPADDDLFDRIGSLGIKTDTPVVVLGKNDNDYSRADTTRVAWTLTIAGVKNVAVLDGGYDKWLSEEKPVSTEWVVPEAVQYTGKVDKSGIATKAYVMSKIGESVITDNRGADAYFGVTVAPFALRPGHIKSATNLPTPWIYTKDGTVKSREELQAMAEGVIGKERFKEVIVYCGAGGFCSAWWWVLTQILEYRNVKYYDGSTQEWAMDPQAPMVKYSWE